MLQSTHASETVRKGMSSIPHKRCRGVPKMTPKSRAITICKALQGGAHKYSKTTCHHYLHRQATGLGGLVQKRIVSISVTEGETCVLDVSE